MKKSLITCLFLTSGILTLAACSHNDQSTTTEASQPQAIQSQVKLGGPNYAEISSTQTTATAKPGETIKIPVTVKNTSTQPFLSGSNVQDRIDLTYHILDSRWTLVTQDGIKTQLPKTLEPGQTENYEINVTAPTQAGGYIVELDLVQEGSFWFKDKGMQPVKIALSVK